MPVFVHRITAKTFMRLALVACFLVAPFANPVNAQFSNRYQFFKALKDQDINEVQEQLNAPGFNADLRNTDGEPAILYAARHGGRGWMALLLKHGANPNLSSRVDGNTVLHYFASKGEKDTVQVLLDEGADPNNINKLGETPLMLAARGRHTLAAQKLIESGADVNRQNIAGRTALEIAQISRARSIERLLKEAGAN
ncbi:MAG: ankyrin repeat domain-containing protein [Pseudomonadota bacterium]